jgi:hypothetical protein
MHSRSRLTRNLLATLVAFTLAAPLVQASTWKQLSPTTSPSAREYPAMAYDPGTKKIVLFGGQGNNGNLNDTWTFDGTTWTQIVTTVTPPVRNGATMALDRPSNKLIMFGGFDTNKYLQDTWVWDGATSTWTQAQMTSPPPPATGAMAFSDPVTGVAMMFGGYNATKVIPVSSFTWRWTGTAWQKLTPSTVPYPRGWGTATHDPVRKNIVLTGGTGDTIRADNTWTWDGTNWTMQSPTTQVSAFIGAGSVFDPTIQLVVLFGGTGETWSWTGSDWVQLTPTGAPSATSGVGMGYDPTTHQTLLFGGMTPGGSVVNETWQLAGR